MAKKHKHEEHINHERYLVTYSDLITLLLAFFIIIAAMSSQDAKKFDEIAQSFSLAFNGGSKDVIDLGESRSGMVRQQITDDERHMLKAAKDTQNLRNVKKKVDAMIKEKNLDKKMTTEMTDKGLKITLTNEILFDSGSAQIKNETRGILVDLSHMLENLQNNISVSGYTDNDPISSVLFPSNWELSSARAVAILRAVLDSNANLNPNLYSASGYGEFHPVGDNDTLEGKAANRRVELFVGKLSDVTKPKEEVKK